MKYGIQAAGLCEQEIKEIGYAMENSFFDYEYRNGQEGIRCICPEREMMCEYLTAFVRAAHSSGLLYATSENGEGYIIVTSKAHDLSPAATWRFLKDCLHVLGPAGAWKMISLSLKSGKPYTADLKKQKIPYMSLEVLCVRKEYWGQGYMRQLMNLFFELADAEHLACYIATDDELKVRKYVHCGTQLMRTRVMNDVFTNYCLYRPVQR